MADKKTRHVIDDQTGGRNGYDAAWAIKDTECADAVNVDFYKSRFGNKRGGMLAAGVSGMTCTGILSSAFRHVPATDETLAELWVADDAATSIINRLAGGTAWAAPTLKDAPTGNGWDMTAASINGKLALAYKTAQNRLHVWDGTTVRRAGLAFPVAAPAVANQGAPSGAATFDAAATLAYGATTTFTHVCGVGASVLWVFLRADTAAVTGVTYNGVAMTLATSVTATGNYYLFYLINPAAGSHTVSIAVSGSSVGGGSASYTGTNTTGIPDATNTGATSGTTLTTAVTTVADNCLAVVGVADRSGTNPTASTNATSRAVPGGGASMTLFESTAAKTPPGSQSISATVTAASSAISLMASFPPAAGSTYAAVTRTYRVRWTRQSSGVTIGRSEPSTAVTFTPDGAHTAARLTQPTVAGEGETHWEVEASTDAITFYLIATVPIATTTYDDSAATTSYANNPISDLTGTYDLQKSYKFIAADQNRLLGFGSYVATDKQARIEISAVIGSSDVGDEERVDTSIVNSVIDLDENDSGVATGLGGPILGSYFAFKDRQVAQLTATGSTDQPYRVDFISKSIGAVAHVAIVRAEDKDGNAALYWMSHRGPYRWSINGLEYIGRNVEDYVLGGNATINLGATKRTAVAVYHQDKRQVWFWWATGASNDPNVGFIFDVQTGGWSRVPSGDLLANIRCATLFANTLGAAMSRDLKPYVGQTGAVTRIWKTDTGTDDNGTAFQAYVDTKAIEPGGAGVTGGVGDASLLAKISEGVTISASVIPDYDSSRMKTGTCSLSATGSETRTIPLNSRLSDSGFAAELGFVQYRIGDAVAVSNAWTLDRLVVPIGKAAAAGA